jgi:hypothetical protein
MPRMWVLTVLVETNRSSAISSAVRIDGSSASEWTATDHSRPRPRRAERGPDEED